MTTRTREDILAAALAEHDRRGCRACSPKYRLSCPNLPGIILEQATAPTPDEEATDATD